MSHTHFNILGNCNAKYVYIDHACMVTLHLLPLMYVYEMNDIMFFIKSYKQQSSHFNITEYVQFSTSNTRFGASEKMVHHRCSCNTAQNFYFYRLLPLWNSLPKIDLSLSTNIIKHKLYNYVHVGSFHAAIQ